MEIVSGLSSLPPAPPKSSIVTWGVFDGVHLGHRAVLRQVVDWARSVGASAVAATFDRHPEEVLRGKPVPLVAPLEERLRRIGELGVDRVVVLPFTLEFSRTSAEAFIRDLVAGRLGARGIVLGHDSRFGRDRGGDLELLSKIGRDFGLEVRHAEPSQFRGRPISSSLIREAVFEGRIADAAELLGRPPAVFGSVVKGDRRGTQLGFPTANLELLHAVRPPAGVYAAEVPLDGRLYRAAVNIGSRPTFRGEGVEMIEVHLLDYPGGDLYGRQLEVRFLSRIRDEKKFDGVEPLKAQIRDDIAFVRNQGSRPNGNDV